MKPEIVTIKHYKNAIFTGLLAGSDLSFNYFTAIICHFHTAMYVGDWK